MRLSIHQIILYFGTAAKNLFISPVVLPEVSWGELALDFETTKDMEHHSSHTSHHHIT